MCQVAMYSVILNNTIKAGLLQRLSEMSFVRNGNMIYGSSVIHHQLASWLQRISGWTVQTSVFKSHKKIRILQAIIIYKFMQNIQQVILITEYEICHRRTHNIEEFYISLIRLTLWMCLQQFFVAMKFQCYTVKRLLRPQGTMC